MTAFEAACAGPAPTGEARTTVCRMDQELRPGRGQRRGRNESVRPEVRAALRAHWKSALAAAEAMVHSAEEGDAAGLVIAADNVGTALARLWELRAARDIDWRTILNHAQGMI